METLLIFSLLLGQNESRRAGVFGPTSGLCRSLNASDLLWVLAVWCGGD